LPDGENLLVIGNEPGKPLRTYRQSLAGGPPQPALPETVNPAAIAPDGRMVVAQLPDGTWQLHPFDGSPAREVPGLVSTDKVMSWSGDGRWLLIRSGGGLPARIERFEIASGRRQLVTEIASADRAGLVGIDPWLTDDPEIYAYGYTRRLSTLFVVTGAEKR